MDADKIKQFFVLHVEKMILAVVAIFALFLIYQGLQLEDFRKEYQPDKLETDAKDVRESIDEDHTEAIIPEREPAFNIVAQTNQSQKPVDFSAYKLVHTWERKDIDSTIRREDPEIVPPRDLIVRSYVGSIAARSRSEFYPLADLEAAERPEKVEEKKPPKRESRRRGRGGGEGGMYGDDEMMMDDLGEMDMTDDYMEDESMAGSSQTWKLGDDVNFGIKPAPVPTLQSSSTKEHPVPKVANFIIGTAVVPHGEMVKSFKQALKSADGYNPARDLPRYYEFQVQRADVTDNDIDELTDDDWVLRGSRRKYAIDAARDWAGFCPEVLPAEFRDNALTTYIPPILIDDYRNLTGHPAIPNSFGELDEQEDDIDEMPLNLDDFRIVNPTGTRRGGDYGGEMEDMMYGAGDYGGRGYSMAMEEDPVDHKLMRFYDFYNPRDEDGPKLGRRYVYRLRVSLIDPNFPDVAQLQPKPGILSGDVYTRIMPLLEQTRGESQRDLEFCQRWSDWSEPSAPASLASGEELYAGPITSGKRFQVEVGNRSIDYERNPPSSKVVLTQLSQEYGVRVPFWTDVTEGSVLSAEGDANVLDPISLEVKNLPDAKVESGSTVIDLDGGYPLTIAEGDDMTEPGMMLLYDAATGRLKVTGELSEQRKYRVYSYADDRGL